jgi:hypothetical protein
VPDSVLNDIAAKDNYRSKLLKELEDINHTEFFLQNIKNRI